MKRLLPLLLLLLLLAPALAEDDPAALMLAAHPGYVIETSADGGDAYAAILREAEQRVLCVAERSGGAWTLVVDNDRALHDERHYHYKYTLSFPSDGELEWHAIPQMIWYGPHEIWRSDKAEGVWQFPMLTEQWHPDEPTSAVTHLTWRDGLLTRTEETWAYGSEIPAVTPLMPLPAAWTRDMTTLSDFDLEARPRGVYDTQMLEGRAVIEAAAELKPDWTYLGGQLLDNHLQLLMDKPDGTRVLLIVTRDDGWRFVESAPLPEDAFYGQTDIYYELQFAGIEDCQIRRYPDNRWGVAYLEPGLEEFYMLLQPGMISASFRWDTPWLIPGEHPWGDVTAIDWTSLPSSAEDVWPKIDTDGWAMANPSNPDVNHVTLYDAPARDAGYLGEYLAGAPLRVLERQESWTKVDVFGVQGWMETALLAFGSDMAAVQPWLEYAYESLSLEGESLYLCPSPDGEPADLLYGHSALIGMCGDDWYHVYDPHTGQAGYITIDRLPDWP